MSTCAVFGCNNHFRSTKGTDLKYYTFPKNEDLARQWMQACRRKDKVNPKRARICSIHFKKECFFENLQHKMLQYSPKNFRNLKDDAIPTLHLPNAVSNEDTSARLERYHVKQRKKMLQEMLQSSASPSGNSHDLGLPNNSVDDPPYEPIQTPHNCIDIENKFKILEKQNAELKDEVVKLNSRIKKLEREKKSVNCEIIDVQTSKNVDIRVTEILSTVFSPGQIKVLISKKKKIKWSHEDICCAIALRSVSAKAYRYLRNKLKYPLPGMSSLRRWVSTFECKPGILKEVLLVMQHNKSNLNDFEKFVVLSYDEVSICKQICFDRKTERIFGPYNHAQVVMARGLTGKWKQPVYYDFDKPMSKTLLFEIIESIEISGFKVIAITSDLGGENRSVWKQLRISPTNTSFQNPFDGSRQIYVFADVPHLLKLARNHFVEKGLVVCGNEHITKSCLEQLLQKQKTDLKIAFKLTSEHLFPKNKQNVKLASQLFSNSNANALRFYGGKGLINGNWKETADIVQMFNDWFDVLNASIPFTSQKEKCAFGVHYVYQKKILDEMSHFINESLVFGHKYKLPFQTGILVTNKSLLDLYTYLSQTHKFQYVLTSKLNQDVLENFFSFIRSMGRTNDHPDASQFITRMRWFIMGKHCTTVMSVKHNTEPDNEECLASIAMQTMETTCPNTVEEECPSAKLLAPLLQQSALNNDEEEELSWDLYAAHEIDSETTIQLEEETNNMKMESLRYVAGYVAFKLQSKFPELGTKDSCENNVTQEFSWIETMSKGGLRIPSNEFLQCAKIIEESFTEFHGLSLRKECNVIKTVKMLADEKIKHLKIPEEAVNRFILVRTYIRMRHLNKFVLNNKKEEEHKKFSKKLQKFKT